MLSNDFELGELTITPGVCLSPSGFSSSYMLNADGSLGIYSETNCNALHPNVTVPSDGSCINSNDPIFGPISYQLKFIPGTYLLIALNAPVGCPSSSFNMYISFGFCSVVLFGGKIVASFNYVSYNTTTVLGHSYASSDCTGSYQVFGTPLGCTFDQYLNTSSFLSPVTLNASFNVHPSLFFILFFLFLSSLF